MDITGKKFVFKLQNYFLIVVECKKTNNINSSMKHCFNIDYKFSHCLGIENSDYPNVDEIYGEIFYSNYEDAPIRIGYIELHFYNYSFIDYGFNLYDAFDRSMNTFNLGNALFDYKSSELKPEIENEIGYGFNSNILVIHEIMLLPEHRCKGYGKEIILGIEEFFNGRCGYIALQSFPKQHDAGIVDIEEFKEFNLKELNSNYKQAQQDLDEFYSKCGFYKLKNQKESYFIKNIG
ncbi:hypothetical protein ACFSTE_02675 [Aquimarina hainanensis]|uniref:N-acetyltransferase domain-containing protein n=1 Tax=Aquimarina hainanensis TaxID=1578017 RepID=A0ABW5N281_9FLAO